MTKGEKETREGIVAPVELTVELYTDEILRDCIGKKIVTVDELESGESVFVIEFEDESSIIVQIANLAYVKPILKGDAQG